MYKSKFNLSGASSSLSVSKIRGSLHCAAETKAMDLHWLRRNYVAGNKKIGVECHWVSLRLSCH